MKHPTHTPDPAEIAHRARLRGELEAQHAIDATATDAYTGFRCQHGSHRTRGSKAKCEHRAFVAAVAAANAGVVL